MRTPCTQRGRRSVIRSHSAARDAVERGAVGKADTAALRFDPAGAVEGFEPAGDDLARGTDPGRKLGLGGVDDPIAGQVQQGCGEAILDTGEGHLFQKPRDVGHAAGEAFQHEAAKGRFVLHEAVEKPGRDQDGAKGMGGDGFAGVCLAADQAERRLDAGLAGINGVKQDLATRGAGEEDLDPAADHDEEALRAVAGAEEHRAGGQVAGRERRKRAAGAVGEIGELIGPEHGTVMAHAGRNASVCWGRRDRAGGKG